MKYLHTMIRVSDPVETIRFFNLLGLQEVRRYDVEAGRFTLIFLAAPGDESAQVELTHNWDTDSYDLGNAYGHIAIEVEDAYAACDAARAKGGNVVREAGPMKHGTTVIAFVEDPDGYKIEFIQKNSGND